jgi:hypothetical protein
MRKLVSPRNSGGLKKQKSSDGCSLVAMLASSRFNDSTLPELAGWLDGFRPLLM